jgi:hypothetical protein
VGESVEGHAARRGLDRGGIDRRFPVRHPTFRARSDRPPTSTASASSTPAMSPVSAITTSSRAPPGFGLAERMAARSSRA